MEEKQNRAGIGGPKTEEGKRKSSLNALKHGLTARSSQAFRKITEECGFTYELVRLNMYEYYRPMDAVEELLVDRIARCNWRLKLSQVMEERSLERTGMPTRPGTSYEKILKYERLVDIHLHRAIAVLAAKRAGQNKQTEAYPGAGFRRS